MRRKLERLWRKTKLEVYRSAYKDQCTVVNSALQQAKKSYYQNKISECAGDQKKLFSIINTLLQRKVMSPLPSLGNNQDTAEAFSHFFKAKIDKIRLRILKDPSQVCPPAQLNSFQPATEADHNLFIIYPSTKSAMFTQGQW